jgi:hypothetical protein
MKIKRLELLLAFYTLKIWKERFMYAFVKHGIAVFVW